MTQRMTVTMKAEPHFKWTSYYLPSKRRSAKEQPALPTFHHHFSSHSVLWLSRNHYPYSTHLVLMLIVEESGRLSSLFHYWKLGNLLVKLDLTIPSVLHHVLSKNFFSRFQAKLRKGRSCEDQITWIVQAIEDGFQQRPM